MLRQDVLELLGKLVLADKVINIVLDLVQHKLLVLSERFVGSLEAGKLLKEFGKQWVCHLTSLLHDDHRPRDLDDVPIADHFMLASTREHGLLQAEDVGEEELVLDARAHETALDKEQKDLRHRSKVSLAHAEVASFESSHNVLVEDLHIRRRVGHYVLNKSGELVKRELPDIKLVFTKAFEGLLDKDQAMSLVFKQLEHVDNDFWVDVCELSLDLLY